jgi:type IV secretion system protein VirB10
MSEQSGGAVAGERSQVVERGSVSLQSRISNALALSLMGALGLGTLVWYYAHALTKPAASAHAAGVAAQQRAQGDQPLPSLGRVEPPALSPSPTPQSPIVDLPDLPLQPAPASPPTAEKSPAEIVLERQLSGAVFTSQAAGAAVPAGAAGETMDATQLAPLLRPSVTAAVRAELLPTQRLLLPKGAFLDCTLETAIDSTLPGMTTCVMASDAFGVDGEVVLLERGTKLVGETRGQVQQGAARVFVLWSEARTPSGVVVPLASPGTDELGRSGLSGEVERHFWDRFGAALLVSVIDGGVQAGVQSTRGNGTVILNPSASQDVMTEALKSTVNIPPTVRKNQGDRVQVLVARDLDFRSVYELKTR